MKKSIKSLICVFIVLFVSFFIGCSDSSTSPPVTTGTTVTTTIVGVIVNESGQPISGAVITSHGQTTNSGSSGEFVFHNIQVPSNRLFVNAAMTGYFKASKGESPVSGGNTQLRITMIQKTVTHTINSGTGGSADLPNGSKVEIQPNSVVLPNGSLYNGTVNMSVVYMDPTSNQFSATVSGGDMAARRSDSSNVYLYSYGILKVVMEGTGGEPLQLQQGSSSTITTTVPASLVGNAPGTIQLWYFDDVSGLWREQGTATLQGGKYVGTVSHFTDWNCDSPGYITSVKGRVVDCNGLPMGGITIKVGQGTTITDSSGNFKRNVPSGVSFNVSIEANQNFGISAPPVPVPALAPDQVYVVPTFNLACYPVIKGKYVDCNGVALTGVVTASWDNQIMGLVYTGGQGFSMIVAPNVQASLRFISNAGLVKDSLIHTPSTPIVMDLGSISMCGATPLGENSFTINGAGYNNQNIVLIPAISFGSYYVSGQFTLIQVIETGANLIQLSFPGNTTGQFTDQDCTVNIQNINFVSSTTSVTVTKYEAVNGIIQGTFSGTFDSPNGTATITNGKFFVIRQPDQN